MTYFKVTKTVAKVNLGVGIFEVILGLWSKGQPVIFFAAICIALSAIATWGLSGQKDPDARPGYRPSTREDAAREGLKADTVRNFRPPNKE